MEGQSSQTQEQVLGYLQQGKALLENNNPQEALTLLQQAHELLPTNVAVRTLLALSHFKLGDLSNAEKIYLDLISENPQEASLRSHLAMQYIQQEQYEKARALLEEAIRVQPEYTTAHSSLGLVYARLGMYADARDSFETANQPEMAERMSQKLKEQAALQEQLPSTEALEELELPVEFDDNPFDDDPYGAAPFDDNPFGSSDPFIPKSSDELALPVVVVPSGPASHDNTENNDYPFSLEPSPTLSPGQAHPLEDEEEEEVSEPLNQSIWLPSEEKLSQKANPFYLFEDNRLLMHVHQRVYTRLQGLVSIAGSPNIHWEFKRFQGKPIEQPFGPSENPLARLDGGCELFFNNQSESFRTILDLDETQAAYFREGVVFAFSDTISWENGRISSPVGDVADLPLDNLWGKGQIVLESEQKIWGITARSNRRVRVEYQRLVGWIGALVPRIVQEEALSSTISTDQAFIEFEGEGGILVTG